METKAVEWIAPSSKAWELYALGKILILIGSTRKRDRRQILILRLCALLRTYGYRTELCS